MSSSTTGSEDLPTGAASSDDDFIMEDAGEDVSQDSDSGSDTPPNLRPIEVVLPALRNRREYIPVKTNDTVVGIVSEDMVEDEVLYLVEFDDGSLREGWLLLIFNSLFLASHNYFLFLFHPARTSNYSLHISLLGCSPSPLFHLSGMFAGTWAYTRKFQKPMCYFLYGISLDQFEVHHWHQPNL
ncbi:hypothetical protein M426DRAFT_20359 [Hypoxylon sp. CI-4A]|nr:hypothetical protein M426DRAFT_20359 [Hypoxylon sp. CI-4A]